MMGVNWAEGAAGSPAACPTASAPGASSSFSANSAPVVDTNSPLKLNPGSIQHC